MCNDRRVLSMWLQPFYFNTFYMPMLLWIYTRTRKPLIPMYTVAEHLSVTPTLYNTVNSSVHTKAKTALSVVIEVSAYALNGQLLIPCKALQIFPLCTRSRILLSCLQCTTGIYHHSRSIH